MTLHETTRTARLHRVLRRLDDWTLTAFNPRTFSPRTAETRTAAARRSTGRR